MPILTQRALVLAKVESTSGVDSVPTATTNAILVNNPQIGFTPNEIVRNFARPDFSPYPSILGRKLSTLSFELEIAGSGTAGVAPRWAPLLAACGMSLTATTAITRVIAAVGSSGAVRASNVVTITTTVAHSLAVGDEVEITGVTNTSFNGAFVVVAAPTTTTFTYAQIGTDVTSGGGTVTKGVTGSTYKPTTNAFLPSITLYCFYEGLLHKITGALGTFSVTADAGAIGMVQFNFTGNYNTPTDTTFPSSPIFDNVIPNQVELASLVYGSNTSLIVQQFKFDMANRVVPRLSVNHANGYSGVRITGRDPKGGINPEAEAVSLEPFWTDAETSNLKSFEMTIGTTAGNQVFFNAPKVQVNSLGYGDRDGLRTYDLGLAFRRNLGNDEIEIAFN